MKIQYGSSTDNYHQFLTSIPNDLEEEVAVNFWEFPV